MVESRYKAFKKVALVIGCPGDKDAKNYCPSVYEDVKMVELWLKNHEFEITTFKDTEATLIKIEDWFHEQGRACYDQEERLNDNSKKFVLLSYFSGHGKLENGT